MAINMVVAVTDGDWFETLGMAESPYMLYTHKALRPEQTAAVTHVDGTSRVQTVSAEQNPYLYAVLGGVQGQLTEQPRDFDRTAALQHIIKGVEPLARLDGIELGGLFRGNVSHGNHQL